MTRPARVLAAVILVLGWGCGGEAEPAADAADTTEAAAARDDTMRVYLSEYRIDMPSVLEAGEIVFTVVNEGLEDHNIRVSDPATDSLLWATDGNVQPGTRVVGRLELAPGNYMVICDFAGHDSRGMFLELQVREAN